jgi:5-methylcytosine-specific restriction endonuclease McrA
MPLKPCIECGRRSEGTRCPEHERQHQRRKNNDARYRRTYAWQQLSRATRAATPQCVRCGSTADLTADHVIPRSVAGGVVTLCRRCNGRKADRT